jgi:hypothetical protein
VLPTYPPTYLPFPHFPISGRQLSTKKATPRHTYTFIRWFSNGDPGPQIPSFPQNPLTMRCGAVLPASSNIPTFGPEFRRARAKAAGSAQSHDCVGGLACREVLRRWMASVAFSSARLVSAQVECVCVYACAGCVQARRMPCWTSGRIGVRWLVSWCGV